MSPDLISAFNVWLDRILAVFGSELSVAYNFNLYAHEESFAVQLVGASRFTADDPFGVTDEVFSSGEDLFFLPRSVVGEDWRQGLKAARAMIERYLETGAQAHLLSSSTHVGIGFVDGDLEVVHQRADG